MHCMQKLLKKGARVQGEPISRPWGLRENVQALVVAIDSPAKKEGTDMVYPACSESCAEALRQGLEEELG